MNRRTLWLVLSVTVIAVAGSAAWLQWRKAQRRAIAEAAVPPLPVLDHWPQALRDQVLEHDRLARSHPDQAVASLIILSRLYHANGFLYEAMQCYAGLEQLQPGDARWLHRHASILAGYGEAEPALSRWRTVVKIEPDYIPAQIRLGDLLLKANHPAEAERIYTRILERKPDEPYARLGLARCDIEAGRWEEARDRLEKLVTDTRYRLGYDLIVTVYEHFGQTARAAAVRGQMKASGAYRDPPDPWIDELIGDCYDVYRLSLTAGALSRAADKAGAMRLLERALALSPDDSSVHFQLAGMFLENREYTRARLHLERCTALAPTFADGWAQLSSLLETIGDREGSQRTLAAGLASCPQSPGLYLMHARNLRKAGKNLEAIEAYQTSIRYRANEAEPYLELAIVLLELGRVDEGVGQLHLALAAEPGHPDALRFLAFQSIQSGDESGAREWLARIREQPRVPQDQVSQLVAAFRAKFERAP